MVLKLRQIEAFRSVMREGSMVRASSAMAITQPAISYLISGLEKEVGFELFSRRGGKLTPTPEALQLMAEVNRLYDGLDGIKAAAQQIANHERATVRVLLTQALASGRIMNAIGQFAVAHPGLKLDVDVDHRLTIMHRISSAQADLGILSLPPVMEGAIATKLFDSELLCVASAPGFLHGGVNVSPADLDGIPVVGIKPGGVIRPMVENWFATAGVSPKFVIEVGDAGAAIELVRAGLGVTIVTSISLPLPSESPIFGFDVRNLGLSARISQSRFEFFDGNSSSAAQIMDEAMPDTTLKYVDSGSYAWVDGERYLLEPRQRLILLALMHDLDHEMDKESLRIKCHSQSESFSPSKEFERNKVVYQRFIRYLRDDMRYQLQVPIGESYH